MNKVYKNKIIFAIFMSIFFSFGIFANARTQHFSIVKNGVAEATIIIPDKVAKEESEAAQVIQKYIKKMSGAQLNIKKESDSASGNLIFIGRVKKIPADINKKLQLDDPSVNFFSLINDAYMLKVQAKDLYLIGHRNRTTLYAAYELLRQIGCRFYFGSPYGIVVPATKNISLKTGYEQFFKPDFSHREHYSWGKRDKKVSQQEKLFKAANRVNNSLSGFCGHNFYRIWPKKKYPELFPEVNIKVQDINVETTKGKKLKARKKFVPYQVCASNPKAAEIGAAWAIKQMEKNPDSDVATFFVNDGGGGDCMCENCKKLGNNADRYVYLINKIGEKFFAKYPDKYLVITSYANCAQVPHRKIKGFDNNSDRVIVMMYEFFSKTPVEKLFAGWAKASHGLLTTMSSYFYHPSYGEKINPRFSQNIFEKIIQRKNTNIRLIRLQTPADWIVNGLNRYIEARLMWDTQTDIEAVKRDFASNMFPSAPNEFYNLIEASCRSSERKISIGDFIVYANRQLDSIFRKCKSEDEKKRWEAYSAWIYFLKVDQELGDKDVGLPKEKVIARQKRFIAIIKGIADYDVVEYGMRVWNHTKILQRYGKMSRNDAKKLFESIKPEKIDAAFLRKQQLAFVKNHPVINGTMENQIFDEHGKIISISKPGISNCSYQDGALEFNVNTKEMLTLELLDKKNRPLMCLFQGKILPGRYKIYWNGADLSGKKIAGGDYSICAKLGGSLVQDKNFGTNGFVQFKNPVNIMISRDDQIYVAENNGNDIYKLSRDGKTSQEFVENARSNGVFCLDKDDNLYTVNQWGLVKYSKSGKVLNNIKIKKKAGIQGVAVDDQGVLWTRQFIGKDAVMDILDTSKNTSRQQRIGKTAWQLAPMHGIYAGPSLATDGRGNFYTADCRSVGNYFGAVQKTLIQDGKLLKHYPCRKYLFDPIGVAVAPNGLIYATERGTLSEFNVKRYKITPPLKTSLLQLWDNGLSLQLSARFLLPEVKGARAVAVDSKNNIYILEDKRDFRKKTQSIPGKGRLFKYQMKYDEVKNFPITVK